MAVRGNLNLVEHGALLRAVRDRVQGWNRPGNTLLAGILSPDPTAGFGPGDAEEFATA